MTTGDIFDLFNDCCDERGIDKKSAALLCIAFALTDVAYQIQNLGNGNASTQMGAIEHLAKQIGDGLGSISDAINAHE